MVFFVKVSGYSCAEFRKFDYYEDARQFAYDVSDDEDSYESPPSLWSLPHGVIWGRGKDEHFTQQNLTTIVTGNLA